MAFPYFTIGHSTRSIADFVDLLTASEIGLIVDVRKFLGRGQIRNTITRRSLDHYWIFRSHMSISPNSVGAACVRRI